MPLLCGLSSGVAASVVGQPLDRARQMVDPPKAMLDGRDHEVAHVFARDPAGRGHKAHGFPIAAVEGKGNPHPLAVIAADLQAIRAPARVAHLDSDTAFVTAHLATTGVALKQKPMHPSSRGRPA